MGLGGAHAPFPVCSDDAGGGPCVCVAIYNLALTESRVLTLVDAWRGMIACR